MYKIFASIIDEETINQVRKLSNSDAYKDCKIRIMPDCHVGKGCTIGSVIQTKNRIVPNTVGVDIGCGMLVVCLGKIDIDLQKLDEVINSEIPSGFFVRETPIRTLDNNFIAKISNWDYIEKSLGTLGGGNHFIEVDEDDEKNKYLVIHTGSRNLGVQVCNYWQEKAIKNLVNPNGIRKELIERLKREGREKEIQDEIKKLIFPKIDNELAYLEGEDYENYIHDMKLCQKYASDNRCEIAFRILNYLHIQSEINWFETIHNYIDNEGIIRKGAVSAKFKEKLIIPINMKEGSLLCVGKGNDDWLCSAPHGAGRILSRIKAKEILNLEDFQKEMTGIYSTSISEETIDESPMVYKPIKSIINDVKDTVDIIKIIKPIYNFKAK